MIAHGDRFHVEKNVILTTNDDITVQQTFNYLCRNLDQYRVGAEFVVVCGVHGSPEGKLLEADEDFRYDYEAMFRWFHNEIKYNRFSPPTRKPFQLVKERNYQMGTVVELSSEEDVNNKGEFQLDENSKVVLKTEFERLLGLNRPMVLILASCWSHEGDLSNILRSAGLYSALRLTEDKAELTDEKSFMLDNTQTQIMETVVVDHSNNTPGSLSARNILLFGSHGTGKTILLTEILLMRMAFYKQFGNVKVHKIIVSCFNSIADDYILLKDLKERYVGFPIFERNILFKNFKSLCQGMVLLKTCYYFRLLNIFSVTFLSF